MQEDYAKTLDAANNTQAPASPLGSFPELAKFFANTFQSPTRQAGLSAYATNNDINVGNQRAGAASAVAAQRAALADKLNRLDPSNPDNYQKIAKNDGGYDFLDPAGNKLTVQQYAQAQSKLTGKQVDPSQVLSDSKNSLDQQYVNDHTNLEKLINYSLGGDVKKRDDLALQLGGQPLVDLVKKGKITPDQLIKQFMSYYPHIYGGQNAGALTDQIRPSGTLPLSQ